MESVDRIVLGRDDDLVLKDQRLCIDVAIDREYRDFAEFGLDRGGGEDSLVDGRAGAGIVVLGGGLRSEAPSGQPYGQDRRDQVIIRPSIFTTFQRPDSFNR